MPEVEEAEILAGTAAGRVVDCDGQRSTWYPDASTADGTFMEWWLNAASILGWLLSTVFVLALASLARSL